MNFIRDSLWELKDKAANASNMTITLIVYDSVMAAQLNERSQA